MPPLRDHPCLVCGPVGLGVVALWSFLGARVIGVDVSTYRRNLADKLGAWRTVEGGKMSTVDRLRKLAGGSGPDTCLECTGKPDAVAAAFEAARKGGKAGIVGEQDQASFNPSRDPIHKELSVYGAWYFRLSEFAGMVELCSRGLKPRRVVTHRSPRADAAPPVVRTAPKRVDPGHCPSSTSDGDGGTCPHCIIGGCSQQYPRERRLEPPPDDTGRRSGAARASGQPHFG